MAHRVGARHRERPGAARGLVVLLGSLHHRLDDRLRAVRPLVVLAPAPDHHHQAPARRERPADVAQRRHRAGEEHGPEPGERHVVRPAEVVGLHVAHREGRVGHPGFGGLPERGPDEPRRHVDAGHGALGAHQPGEALRHVAEAATHVEDALPRSRREPAHGLLAVDAEPDGEEMPEADEAVEEGPVPGGGGLLVALLEHGVRLGGLHGDLLWRGREDIPATEGRPAKRLGRRRAPVGGSRRRQGLGPADDASPRHRSGARRRRRGPGARVTRPGRLPP